MKTSQQVQKPYMYVPTERTRIVVKLCLRFRIGLWGKYYYAPFDITHYFLLMWGLQILLFGLHNRLVTMEDEAT